jgi:hypothetical protein
MALVVLIGLLKIYKESVKNENAFYSSTQLSNDSAQVAICSSGYYDGGLSRIFIILP